MTAQLGTGGGGAHLGISGIQEAQQANLKILAELKPSGALGKAVQYATAQAHRYAVSITHVDTGALRASHRTEAAGATLKGNIYLDPTARNPRSNKLTSEYGPYEEARGGTHAFYERTYREAGADIAHTAQVIFLGAMP